VAVAVHPRYHDGGVEERMAYGQAWLDAEVKEMRSGIQAGKTRRRNIASCNGQGVTEQMVEAAAKAQGWRVAQVGDDYIFAPKGYIIRPIV
jgi:hypothetical protein